jgi:hypothetical protein
MDMIESINAAQRQAQAFNSDAERDRLRAQVAQVDRQCIALMGENTSLRQALQDALQLIPAKTIAASPAIAAWVEQTKSLLK